MRKKGGNFSWEHNLLTYLRIPLEGRKDKLPNQDQPKSERRVLTRTQCASHPTKPWLWYHPVHGIWDEKARTVLTNQNWGEPYPERNSVSNLLTPASGNAQPNRSFPPRILSAVPGVGQNTTVHLDGTFAEKSSCLREMLWELFWGLQ